LSFHFFFASAKNSLDSSLSQQHIFVIMNKLGRD
jgi:hypothetical protein